MEGQALEVELTDVPEDEELEDEAQLPVGHAAEGAAAEEAAAGQQAATEHNQEQGQPGKAGAGSARAPVVSVACCCGLAGGQAQLLGLLGRLPITLCQHPASGCCTSLPSASTQSVPLPARLFAIQALCSTRRLFTPWDACFPPSTCRPRAQQLACCAGWPIAWARWMTAGCACCAISAATLGLGRGPAMHVHGV